MNTYDDNIVIKSDTYLIDIFMPILNIKLITQI